MCTNAGSSASPGLRYSVASSVSVGAEHAAHRCAVHVLALDGLVAGARVVPLPVRQVDRLHAVVVAAVVECEDQLAVDREGFGLQIAGQLEAVGLGTGRGVEHDELGRVATLRRAVAGLPIGERDPASAPGDRPRADRRRGARRQRPRRGDRARVGIQTNELWPLGRRLPTYSTARADGEHRGPVEGRDRGRVGPDRNVRVGRYRAHTACELREQQRAAADGRLVGGAAVRPRLGSASVRQP